VGPAAPPERQAVAASAFTALINAFFVSLAALISNDTVGSSAMAVSAVSIIATLRLLGDLFPSHLRRRVYLRHVGFLAIGLIVYGLQFYDGFQYNRYPHAIDWSYAIANLLLAIYGTGLTRAWQLLGARRRGVFSWFSPLNDLDEAPAMEIARSVDAAPAKPKPPHALEDDARTP
jgi:hypothetical protein